MSYYNSVISTRQIDPVFHKSLTRSEFRLESDSLYVSNFRLMNVGVVVNEATNRYNLLIGAQPVKNIFLYDGKQMLDSVVGFGNLEAFRRYSKSNSENCDMQKNYKCHGMGFMFYREPETEASVVPSAKVAEFNATGANIPQTTEDATPKSYMNLQEVFSLLKNVDYIHTGVFKDLRVVIEYDASASVLEKLSSSNTRVVASTYPLLVVDQVVDEAFSAKFLKEFKQIVFNAIETEIVQLGHEKETTNFKLTAFCGKTVQRLLIQKQGTYGTSETSIGYSNFYRTFGSEAMLDEEVQIVVDGQNWLPNDGLTKPNQKLGLLTDTFSICNTTPAANLTCIVKASDVIENWNERVGHLDYIGLNISKKVQNLQLNYKRKAVGQEETYKQAIIINIFGEVSKAIAMTPSGYQVIYL